MSVLSSREEIRVRQIVQEELAKAAKPKVAPAKPKPVVENPAEDPKKA